MSPETSLCEVLNEVLWKLRADFVYDNGIIEIKPYCMSDGETLI